jgi:hypothetical protein
LLYAFGFDPGDKQQRPKMKQPKFPKEMFFNDKKTKAFINIFCLKLFPTNSLFYN